jgi:hypothetical protein
LRILTRQLVGSTTPPLPDLWGTSFRYSYDFGDGWDHRVVTPDEHGGDKGFDCEVVRGAGRAPRFVRARIVHHLNQVTWTEAAPSAF